MQQTKDVGHNIRGGTSYKSRVLPRALSAPKNITRALFAGTGGLTSTPAE